MIPLTQSHLYSVSFSGKHSGSKKAKPLPEVVSDRLDGQLKQDGDTATVYQDPWVSLIIKCFGGENWAFLKRRQPNIALAVPVVNIPGQGKSIVLIEQIRATSEQPVIELAGGLIGDKTPGERVDQATTKELREEAGLSADNLSYLGKSTPSAGISNETLHFSVTEVSPEAVRKAQTDLAKGNTLGVGSEHILQLHVIPLNRLGAWLEKQEKRNKTIATSIPAAYGYLALQNRL